MHNPNGTCRRATDARFLYRNSAKVEKRLWFFTEAGVLNTVTFSVPQKHGGISLMTHWCKTLFANFAKTYDREVFTQGTLGEVDFVERELGSDRSKRILDIARGTGRYATELVKRGYHVTGFDLSEGQLQLAREKAAADVSSFSNATQPSRISGRNLRPP